MFSTAVKLANLDDYLESAQDCTISLISDKDGSKPKIQVMKNSKVKSREDSSLYTEKATVNVADCLACSGCVTSSEAKLLESQNVEQFLKEIKQKKFKVASLSNQSCASLAAHYNCDLLTVQRKLSGLFKGLGINMVINLTISEYISLIEAKEEFKFRLNQENECDHNESLPLIISHCPGWICYAEKSLDCRVLPLLSRARSAQQIQGILVKTLTMEIYNQLLFLYKWRTYNYPFCLFLGNLRTIFKGNFDYINESDIFHIAIMPCHDKKLESTRPSLSLSVGKNDQSVPEVDIVLTTEEVHKLIEISDFNSFLEIPEAPMDNLWLNQPFSVGELGNSSLICLKNHSRSFEHKISDSWLIPSHFNSGSGGYCEYIIRDVVNSFSNCTKINSNDKLPFNKLKSGILEGSVKLSSNEIVYCLVYGFKAIQSIAKRLGIQRSNNKSSVIKEKIHLVEVMACPSGCISGGGQILRLQESENDSEVENFKKNAKLIEKMDTILHDGVNSNDDKDISTPESIPIVKTIFEYLKYIDKDTGRNDYCNLPFLRNDFVSFDEKQISTHFNW